MRNLIKNLVAVFLLLTMCMPTVSFASSSNTVTYSDVTYSYYEDGSAPEYNKHAIFTSSIGSPVYCGNHVLPTPVGNNVGDSKSLEMHEYSDGTVRKILYYGYLGPKEWEGFSSSKYNGVYKAGTAENKRVWCGNAVTGIALTKTQDKGYVYDVSGLKAFWEFIQKAPDPPKGFKAYIMYGNSSEQNLFTWVYNAEGYLKIKKQAENYGDIVEDCSKNYSLEGAEYIVSRDVKGEYEVGRLKTTDEGESNTLTLKTGTYFLKEIVAPKGFQKDNITHVVIVREGETNTYQVEDKPLYHNMDIVLLKKDSKSKKGLEGAIYEVNYYAELIDDLEGKNPDKTWRFKTDSEGVISLKDSYKVGGDSLYKDDAGNPVGLIGTYEITEIEAPKGYARDTKTYIKQVSINKITGSSALYNYPEISNTLQTVSIILQKHNNEADNVQEATYDLSDAVYEVKNEAGEVVGKIETDKDGKGKIKNLKPGKYILREIKAPVGFVINKEEVLIDAKVKDDVSKTFEYTIETGDNPTVVEISKVERKDNVEELVKGATLQILNSQGEVVKEFITEEKVHVIKYLPAGKYILREIEAPPGYVKAEDVHFEIKDDVEVTEVVMENKKMEVPDEPVIPDEPDEPKVPEEPNGPEEPDEPEVPDEPEKPVEPEVPSEPEVPAEPEAPTRPQVPVEPPKTGDLNDIYFWYRILLVVSFAVLIGNAGSAKRN